MSHLCSRQPAFLACGNEPSPLAAPERLLVLLDGRSDRFCEHEYAFFFTPQCSHSLCLFKIQVGWAIGSGILMKHLRTIHQNTVYHSATAAQVIPYLMSKCNKCDVQVYIFHHTHILGGLGFNCITFWFWSPVINRRRLLVHSSENTSCLGVQKATSSSCPRCCTSRGRSWPRVWRVWVCSLLCQREAIL